jgi:hypothetical protein
MRTALVALIAITPAAGEEAAAQTPVAAAHASVPNLPLAPRRVWPEHPGPPVLRPTDPGVVTAASLIVPGAGQLLLGQRRWTIYAALEAVGWLVHLDRRRSGRHLRTEYRDVAWQFARDASPEPRQDGDWEYYERLEHWTASGDWDAEPARAGVQPESDAQTFNGSVWALASDLFRPGGEGEGSQAYAAALAYYQARAVPPELLWDWTGQETSLERYRELIDRSDEDLRTATVVLGAVVANHLFSAADAYVSSRLARPSPVGASVGLRPAPRGLAVEWRAEIRP